MRLADFILANVEPILVEWESFARGIWPHGATADPAEMRDEAEDILRATALDMQSHQTAAQQAEKSKGASRQWDESGDLTRASSSHGAGRVGSGFDLGQWSLNTGLFAQVCSDCGARADRHQTCATSMM